MHTRSTIFLALLLAFSFQTAAIAKTDKCTRVESIARIGLPDGMRYVQEDGARDEVTGGPYCAFSVNGVAASSPPRERVLEAYKNLETGGAIQSDSFLQDVGFVLISASRLTEPPSDLMEALSDGKAQLASCFTNFVSKEVTDGRLEFDAGFCQVTFEDTVEGETILATGQPPSLVLHIRIDASDINRWAFIPIEF